MPCATKTYVTRLVTRRLSEAKGGMYWHGNPLQYGFSSSTFQEIFNMNAVDVCLMALSFTNITMCFKERLIHALSIRRLRTESLTENLMCLFDDCTEKLLCIVISYAACSNAWHLESADLTPGSSLSTGMWLPMERPEDSQSAIQRWVIAVTWWVRKEKEITICKVNEVRNFIRWKTRFVKWAEGSQIAACVKCDAIAHQNAKVRSEAYKLTTQMFSANKIASLLVW